MSRFRALRKFNLSSVFLMSSLMILWLLPPLAAAQTNRYLIYPEIATALRVEVPNKVCQNKK